MTGSSKPDTYAETSAGVGFVVWLGVVFLYLTGAYPLSAVGLFLALAVLVVFPLCLSLVSTPCRDGTFSSVYRVAVYGQPLAGVLALVSLSVENGFVAGVVALPWFLLTVVVATFGLVRLLPRGARPVEELLVDAGLLYSSVGGFWFVVSRSGANPLGFSDVIVALTAVHFHYAGFFLPLLLGLTGRVLLRIRNSRLFVPAGYAVVVAPAFVALGITFSPLLETASVALLGGGVAVISLLGLARVVPELDGISRMLVAVSYVSVVGVVALGFSYAVTSYGVTHVAETERYLLDIPTMLVTHGVLASVGFSLIGAIGWRLVVRYGGVEPRVPPPGVPFSDLRARWKVGADFFERAGVDEETEATGMVDDLSEYDDERFDASLVHQDARDFYENTDAYRMVVVPDWERGFGTVGRLYGVLASSFENVRPSTVERSIEGAVVGVDDEADGREDVRAWTRWDAETGEGILVGTYSSHVYDGTRYMGFGAPVPGASFSGVIRFENIDGNGLLLTTYDGGDEPESYGGDGGLYLVTPFVPIRLPLDERLSVWAFEEAPEAYDEHEADVVVRHEMYVFGRRFVTLVYYATRGS